jgi:hypothetical protein
MTPIVRLMLIALLVTACATTSEAPQPPAGPCTPTKLVVKFTETPSDLWRTRLESSAALASTILSSDAFAAKCVEMTMRRTNDRTVSDVCRHVACAGEHQLAIGFFHDANTRAIASEGEDGISINTAKADAGAGTPGNLVHEFTHILGYTHWTNWAFLGKRSVPYMVGNLVDEIAESH